MADDNVELIFSLSLDLPNIPARPSFLDGNWKGSSEPFLSKHGCGVDGERIARASHTNVRELRDRIRNEYEPLFAELATHAQSLGGSFDTEQSEYKRVDDRPENPFVNYYDGGPEVASLITGVLTAAGGAGLALNLLRGLKEVIIKWIDKRPGRTVTIKAGAVFVKVDHVRDLEKAMRALADAGPVPLALEGKAAPVTRRKRGKLGSDRKKRNSRKG